MSSSSQLPSAVQGTAEVTVRCRCHCLVLGQEENLRIIVFKAGEQSLLYSFKWGCFPLLVVKHDLWVAEPDFARAFTISQFTAGRAQGWMCCSGWFVVCGTGLQLRAGRTVPAHAVLFQLQCCLCGLAVFTIQMRFCAAPSAEASLGTRSEEKNAQAV